jgi:hypothetical protein
VVEAKEVRSGRLVVVGTRNGNRDQEMVEESEMSTKEGEMNGQVMG